MGRYRDRALAHRRKPPACPAPAWLQSTAAASTQFGHEGSMGHCHTRPSKSAACLTPEQSSDPVRSGHQGAMGGSEPDIADAAGLAYAAWQLGPTGSGGCSAAAVGSGQGAARRGEGGQRSERADSGAAGAPADQQPRFRPGPVCTTAAAAARRGPSEGQFGHRGGQSGRDWRPERRPAGVED